LAAFIGHPALRTMGVVLPPSRIVLAARVWHVKYGLSAVQLTPLLWDGIDRDRSLKRKTYGPLKGGGVWIGTPSADEEVVIAEGLESVLSALIILERRCGVATLGPNFHGLTIPSCVKRLRIAADNDETGRGSAERAAKVWRAHGLYVQVSMPDNEGEDFNDVLRRRT
jgi:hypothetical protein